MDDGARALFYREYGHSITDRKAFEFSFGQTHLSRKAIKLGRELSRDDTAKKVLYLGSLKSGARSTTQEVTVRVQHSSDLQQQSAMLKEAMVLHRFRHDNILALLHACCEELPVYVVTEYMAQGDLRTFLRACRPGATRQRQVLAAVDLHSICQQVVAALVYLESQHLVHRGLAAESFLVGRDASDVRLAHLGRSRDVYVSEVYIATRSENAGNKDEQNIRWLAPECLQDAEFTHKSDVWAMGVVIYEVTSYARTPYGNMSAKEISKDISTGLRLEQPPACPDDLYALMRRMWNSVPRLRPTFAEVQGELIMQMLPDAAMLVAEGTSAREQGMPRSWGIFAHAQLRAGKAFGARRVLVEIETSVCVGERFDSVRLAVELQVWRTLRHEHVVRFVGVCPEAGLLLHVHEPAGSVRSLLAARPVPPRQCVKMLLECALGLDFLHVRGIVHGRLSAAQLLLTGQDGAVAVCGFSAAGFDVGVDSEPAWTCPLARTTGEFSSASDVFSFAATVYEIACYPAVPPMDASIMQDGRPELGGLINELLRTSATRLPDGRPPLSHVISVLEIVFYGEERWQFPREQLTQLQILGSGAFGVVNKMAARGISRPGATTLVAVKTLKTEATPESESEFLAEMQLMMKLRHPNLVNLLGVVTKDDPLMLILEFLPGGSLDRWLQSAHDIGREDQLYILYQVALGMGALHARGILHRDLAARNVLVGVDLLCKVADYGLSREVTAERDYYRHKTDRALPLRWMAPEVRQRDGQGVAGLS